MGSGHVMRCLTLADSLHTQETDVAFICRDLPGNMCNVIEQKGYEVYRLPYRDQTVQGDADELTVWSGETWEIDAEQTCQVLQKLSKKESIRWLIMDHYGLDKRWEQRMRPYVQKIMIIDDLANREHDCELLLDQNLYLNMQTRYQGLVPKHCQTLLGPQYALLRPEFYEARKKLKVRDGNVRRILVFFGGSDPTNETGKALEAIQLLNRNDIHVDVVVGGINPHKEQIERMCKQMPNASFYCQVNNMAELMANADLAIGAGGTTTWERCFLGLPVIAISVANNQAEVLEILGQKGVIMFLGFSEAVSQSIFAKSIKRLFDCPESIRDLSKRSLMLISTALNNANFYFWTLFGQ